MSDIHITCINKIPRQDPHEGIKHLGTPGRKWTRDEVIRSIESGAATFYTQVDGKRADIVVVNNPHGGKYVRTLADRYFNNDLLALPESP
jgi:hypothetical protein